MTLTLAFQELLVAVRAVPSLRPITRLFAMRRGVGTRARVQLLAIPPVVLALALQDLVVALDTAAMPPCAELLLVLRAIPPVVLTLTFASRVRAFSRQSIQYRTSVRQDNRRPGATV